MQTQNKKFKKKEEPNRKVPSKMDKHLYLVTLTDATHFSETYLQTISKMCIPRMNKSPPSLC